MTIEQILIDYLNDGLGVPVYAERPKSKACPSSYVLIERTGYSVENYIKNAMVAIQAYGQTMEEAMLLNESIIDLMGNIENDARVFCARLNSSYNYTDTTTKEYRYQSVYDIYY